MKTNESCRMAHFGTFDIESLGDSMFAPVLEAEMRKRFSAVGITLFSLNEVEDPYNGNSHVYSFDQFDEIHREQPFDAVVIGGGEMLNFQAISFSDRHGNRFEYAPGEVWAKPVRLACRYGLPILLNCVGVSRSFTPAQARFVGEYLPGISYISVRDRFSRLRIEAAGPEGMRAREVCDSLWLFSRHYPPELLDKKREELGPALSVDFSLPYVVLQYGTTHKYMEVVSAARKIREKYGFRIFLVPVNRCHEDLRALNMIAEKLGESCVLFREKLQPLEIMSVISGAQAFLGTTLHGTLIALSYGVKALAIDMYPTFVSKMDGLFDQVGLTEYFIPEPPGIVPAFDRLMADPDFRERVMPRIRLFQERLDSHFDEMAELIKEKKMNRTDAELHPYSGDTEKNPGEEELAVKSYLTVQNGQLHSQMLLSSSVLDDGKYSFLFPRVSFDRESTVTWTHQCGEPCGIRPIQVLLDGREAALRPLNAVRKEGEADVFCIPSAQYRLEPAEGTKFPVTGELVIACEITQLPADMKAEVLTAEIRNQAAWIESLLRSENDLKAMLERAGDMESLIRQTEKLKGDVAKKDAHIQELLESERQKTAELSGIYRSRGWRMLVRLYGVEERIAPPNSKRRLFARLILKALRHPLRYIKKLNPRSLKNFYKVLKEGGVQGVNEKILDMEVLYDGIPARPLDLVDMKKTSFSQLVFPKCDEPAVSIVIPVYNKFNYTYGCLEAILTHTRDVDYEVIIADDCSTDQTKDIESIVRNIVVSKTSGNQGFLRNCNRAAGMARGRYIHFLNNDTNVQDGWLSSLVGLLEKNPDIGMTGSKLVYPDGRLQEAGGILWNDSSAWNFGKFKNPEAPEYNYVRDADYISGASILIRTSLWREIGGFDERYVPAYYEDTDLAFEVRNRGFRVVYQPQSVVVHFEGISHGTSVASGLKAYQVTNQKKFFEKWQAVLEANHFPNGENVFLARDRSRGQKHILVVDHYVPHHDKDAGGKCTYMYIKLFLKLGMRVTFIGDNFFAHQPYTAELEQMGVEVLYGNYYQANWQHWLKENGRHFDYAYLQRPHISVKYIDVVKKYSDARIIYFGHDLHYLREYREYELSKDPAKLAASEDWKKKEFALFEKADVVFVVGSYEQEILKKEFPGKPIYNIPVYIYEGLKPGVNTDFRSRRDIVFVGGFAHKPNIDAVLWFAENVFPGVLARYPDIKWYIVGSKPPKEVLALQDDHRIVTGFISDEELESMYARCRLAVVPLRFGAGVKGKVVEATYNRLPMVTTPIGAEGLSLEEDAFVVSETDETMIDAVNDLYEDFDRLGELSRNCQAFITNHFTEETARKIVLESFRS